MAMKCNKLFFHFPIIRIAKDKVIDEIDDDNAFADKLMEEIKAENIREYLR